MTDVEKGTASGDKPVKKPALAEAHPEIEGEYLKINSACIKAREARGNGGALPGPLKDEIERLLAWADGVIDETIDDRKAFEELALRDRDTFATALRLKGNQQMIAQLITACGELRAVLAPL